MIDYRQSSMVDVAFDLMTKKKSQLIFINYGRKFLKSKDLIKKIKMKMNLYFIQTLL